MTVNRRTVIKGALAAGVATPVLRVPAAPAQAAPIRVGFLTIKTGPLASGGLQMEQGLTVFFKERNNMLAGRPVELHTADTGGNPAQARTKTQELVERFNVAVPDRPARRLRGAGDRRLHPLVADADPDGRRRRGHDPAQAQSLARAAELHLGAAEPSARRLRRQGPQVQARRRASPTISPSATRTSPASSACSRTTAARWCRSCSRRSTLPTTAPTSRSSSRTSMPSTPATPARTDSSSSRQLREYGNKGKSSAASRRSTNRCCSRWATTRSAPSPATGIRPSSTTRSTRSSSTAIQRDYKVDPGVYAAETYLCGEVLEHALKAIGGKIEDKDAFMKALQGGEGAEHLARPGALRRARQRRRQHLHPQGREEGRQATSTRWSRPIPDVSQFWTYKQDEFLKNPVYSRDYPPAKNLEQ